jgi:hypothetical protein
MLGSIQQFSKIRILSSFNVIYPFFGRIRTLKLSISSRLFYHCANTADHGFREALKVQLRQPLFKSHVVLYVLLGGTHYTCYACFVFEKYTRPLWVDQA